MTEEVEDVEAALETYEASKAYALRGTPSYLVTLNTPSGIATVRGLDERPLDEILNGLRASGPSEGSFTMVLRGAERLVNYGVVVARPKDVISISSMIETHQPDDHDDGDDDDDDDDDGADTDNDTDTDEEVTAHPMLKVKK